MAATPVRRGLLGRTYLKPLVIALVSSAGLLFALIGDGLWDYLSWLALGFPVAIGLWFWLRRAWPGRARAERP
ncbi:MAG TPA: hypothetical protein VFD26_10565 [Methyloceanibacter sp.]|nr:hypothetical protein [Methyloceanibacter sp.]